MAAHTNRRDSLPYRDLPKPNCYPTRHALDRLALKISLGALSICAAIVSVNRGHLANWTTEGTGSLNTAPASSLIEDRIDQDLFLTAKSVLGQSDGTVIVMDPKNGRVRAVVNQQVAFAEAFPPGSTIKPFSALAGLRTRVIKSDSRIACREHYVHEEFETVCSHPRDLAPLTTTEAIAYSCNYYFGRLGEKLTELSFRSTLAEFGFGQQTGINGVNVRESKGKLPDGRWRAQYSMGEGDKVQVTPIQLLTAYSALVNGGDLFKPRIAESDDFGAEVRGKIDIKDEHRRLIIAGMRSSVRYGTAERAALPTLPLYIFGKTGTATELGGFRTHGWFVGFAAKLADESPETSKNCDLAVLVFLKRAHGVQAAELARTIFEAYVRGVRGDAATRGRGDIARQGDGEMGGHGVAASPQLRVSAPSLRVHLARENLTRSIPLEDYVLGVVASEGSTETETEALKALAVASRTYAVKNLRRHSNEGYDFCTTTHCQRYRLIEPVKGGSLVSSAIFNAVRNTASEILRDGKGQIVDSYFSASCGGATANIGTLWGVTAPSYLTGGRDEYCLTMPHHAWTDLIPAKDLLKALKSDTKTDVGDRLVNVSVARRDASGRAQLIAIEGARRRIVSGWDFKIIVGRALGWNLLKSSRFQMARSGSNYIFHGSGFGHGLGLCQEGAHVMARRGATYQQILAKYFPGTTVEGEAEAKQGEVGAGRLGDAEKRRWGDAEMGRRGDAEITSLRTFADLLWEVTSHPAGGVGQVSRELSVTIRQPISASPRPAVSSRRRTLSSEHFRINYPTSVGQTNAEYLSRFLESSRVDLIRHVSTSGVVFQFPAQELFINETTGDFVGRTGQPPWAAAATRGNRIELQPLELLKRRRILETTLRHELVHVVIDTIGRGRTPRWLAEGLAIHVAGEGQTVSRYQHKTEISFAEIEKRLSQFSSAEDMRAAYAAAYREVKRLFAGEGEAAVWRRVAGRTSN